MSIVPESVKLEIRRLFACYPQKQALTLPAFHLIQQQLRCVPREAITEIAELLELSPAQIFDTLSFYGFFRDEEHPLGRKRIWVCRSLPCMLRGGDRLLAESCERLRIAPGETTANGEATLEVAECLGACEGAPCILVNDELQMCVDVETIVRLAE
jgi:NADH-quinone oxidoreductase subunit E